MMGTAMAMDRSPDVSVFRAIHEPLTGSTNLLAFWAWPRGLVRYLRQLDEKMMPRVMKANLRFAFLDSIKRRFPN